uniref:G-protein coupled receptors family 1 profile domain-containing protein n=1 Tax=Megaselia scalaris TaxID=36166 RepID=T1H2V7_MEGSC
MTPHIRKCKPTTDGVSSLEDLLTKPVLRYSAWMMAFLTMLGNILVLWGRFIYRDENRTVTIVIRNLAMSDILMGFYLIFIGIQDYRFRSRYHEFAMEWITSWHCAAIDFMCWAPIIGAKIYALFSFNISDDTYAWLVVFILPLNSAINPLLYTFTTPKYRNQILGRNWKKFTWSRKNTTSGTATATATGTATASNPSHPS